MFDVPTLLVLCPFLPLAATLIIAGTGPRLLRDASHWVAIAGIGAAAVCALCLVWHVETALRANDNAVSIGYERIVPLWTWLDIEDAYDGSHMYRGDENSELGRRASDATAGSLPLRIEIALRLDPLTAVMLATVNFIALLVVVYSSGYMRGDRGYWRFFAYVSLFVFSMNVLVTASNFLLLFAAWEGVGVCSYLLIGHWYVKPEAAAAGKKAFLVNRVGDFGFTLAMFLIWITYGTLSFHDAGSVAGVLGQTRLETQAFVGGGLGFAICALLLLGACGKSAQFPLHVWLADAMEGPTPVSALIHAATMVTAGVYMVARCTPLFWASPPAQLLVACIGGGTALIAGMIALTQFDLKRVLAYSTISQLGYMFLGLGVGTLSGVTAGVFHLFTHAFFKALLFLGAGSVMHAMGNVIDMRRFGGLRSLLPKTHATFAIGCLALAGLVPFAGFWSKDAIIAAVRDQQAACAAHLQPPLTFGPSRTHDLSRAGGGASQPGRDGLERPSYTDRSAGTPDLIKLAALGATVSQVGHDGRAQDMQYRGMDHELEALRFVSQPHGTSDTGSADSVAHPDEHQLSTAHLRHWSPCEVRWASSIYQGLYFLALGTAFLTAIYTFRAFYMTFYGDQKIPPEAGQHAHESPPVMWGPLAVLAVGSVLAGWVMHRGHVFAEFLDKTPSLSMEAVQVSGHLSLPHLDVALWSTLVAIAGIAVASFLYLGPRTQAEWLCGVLSRPWSGFAYQLSRSKFFFDEIYDVLIVRPARGLGQVLFVLDRYLVDGLVDAVGSTPGKFGALVRRLQCGFTPYYGFGMLFGAIVLALVCWLWEA